MRLSLEAQVSFESWICLRYLGQMFHQAGHDAVASLVAASARVDPTAPVWPELPLDHLVSSQAPLRLEELWEELQGPLAELIDHE